MHAIRMIQAGLVLGACYAATAIMATIALTVLATAVLVVGISGLAKAQ